MHTIAIDALPMLGQDDISNFVRPFAEKVAAMAPADWTVSPYYRLGELKRLRAYRRLKISGHLNPANARETLLPDKLLSLLPRLPAAKGVDIFLATTDFVPADSRFKTGWFVHDVVPLQIPRFFKEDPLKLKSELRARARRARFIVTISKTTRDDLAELLEFPEDRIFVAYPGVGVIPADIKPRAVALRPYIYYVGALAKNKNVDGLLRVFARCIHKHGLDLDLWLTGKDFCGPAFWKEILSNEMIEDRVHFTGWIPEAEKESLFRGAVMLWQFSWYEGFGLPVLEAAARGVPALYTNRGAVKEILASSEQEIDPEDEVAAAQKAAKALKSPEILEWWRSQGLRRVKDFSWEKTAADFWNWLPGVVSA